MFVGNEYIFQTQYLDEEFVQHRNTRAPHDKIGQERFANVSIANADYAVMLVEESQVNEYFSWDEDAVKRQSVKFPETDAILPELGFIAMDIKTLITH